MNVKVIGSIDEEILEKIKQYIGNIDLTLDQEVIQEALDQYTRNRNFHIHILPNKDFIINSGEL